MAPRYFWIGIGIGTLAGWPAHLSATAWENTLPFSAEVVRSNSRTNTAPARGHMYVGQEGVRTETLVQGEPVIMIFKPASGVVWMLFPNRQEYMENRTGKPIQRPPLPDESNSPCQQRQDYQCRSLGVTNLYGRSTLRWQIDQTTTGKPIRAFLWIDPRLKVPIREEYPDGATVEMLNIQEGQQPAQLFQIPGQYKQVQPPAPPEQKSGAAPSR
jgi:hypothetical protein